MAVLSGDGAPFRLSDFLFLGSAKVPESTSVRWGVLLPVLRLGVRHRSALLAATNTLGRRNAVVDVPEGP